MLGNHPIQATRHPHLCAPSFQVAKTLLELYNECCQGLTGVIGRLRALPSNVGTSQRQMVSHVVLLPLVAPPPLPATHAPCR